MDASCLRKVDPFRTHIFQRLPCGSYRVYSRGTTEYFSTSINFVTSTRDMNEFGQVSSVAITSLACTVSG